MRRYGAVLWLGALMACADAPPDVPPPDAPDALGPFDIGHTSFDATDASRDDRTLRVDVWYPVDAGKGDTHQKASYLLGSGFSLDSDVALYEPTPASGGGFPLLVFSHGYQSINTQSTGLMEALASHGFVVASPEHTGNSQASPDADFDAAAMARVPDVSFVIDTLFARSDDGDDLFAEHLDTTRAGVLGHSFGGMTAVGSAAGWAGANADPRVVAIVPISAVIDGDLQSSDRDSANAGFSPAALDRIEVPVLLLGGTEDTNVPIGNNQLAFDHMTGAPFVYKVDVVGANHTHFANICVIGQVLLGLGLRQDQWSALGAGALLEPYEATCTADAFPFEEAVRLSNLYTVAFFRRHMLGEAAYSMYLTPEYAEAEPDVRFAVRP